MQENSTAPDVQTFPRSQRQITLGRDPSCDVQLKGVGSSRFHALVMCDENGVWIQDTNSSFGIRVNNVPVKKAQLADGVVITVGIVRFKLSYTLSEISFYSVRELEKGDTRAIPVDHGDVTTVGRDASNKLCLAHPLVSRFHATVLRKAGVLTIIDHGSTNATFVNGEPAHRKALDEGDIIQIGPYRLFVTGARCSKPRTSTASGSRPLTLACGGEPDAFEWNISLHRAR